MKILFFAAVIMMAHQVMGKATRDSLFLTYFSAAELPLMRIAAALFAMLVGLSVPRLFQRYSLARTVPAAFALSGLLHLLEYTIRNTNPRLTAVLVFLHIVSLSAILLSSFWLLLSERFDPGQARRWFGKFAAWGTLGGVAGGLAAERWAAAGFSGLSLLLLLGLLHLLCGIVLLGQAQPRDTDPVPDKSPWLAPGAALASAPYLRALALIVFLGTTSAAIIDLLFTMAAQSAFDSGPALLRFFALFHTATQVIVFLLQSLVVQTAVQRFSLGWNIAALPCTVILGACGGFLLPVFPMFALARGCEYLLRGSFFRSGYEIFYTPIPPREKRAAKSLIDVVCDRLGDAVGGFVVQAFLPATVGALSVFVLPIAALIGVVNLVLSLRLDRSYSHVVHRGLTDRARQIDGHLSQYGDWSLDTILLESLPRLRPSPLAPAGQPEGWTIPLPPMDEPTRHVAALRSGDPERVRRTLDSLNPVDPVLVPVLVELLGWSEVWKNARAALARTGGRHTGLFIDWLSDPDTDLSIRRRLPSVLAAAGGPRAVQGLLAGLTDSRFEVRFECARALHVAVAAAAHLAPAREPILAAIDRELSLPPQVWQNRTAADEQPHSIDTPGSGYLERPPERPAGYRLELVFSLLSLLHPRDPLVTAFRALHSTDPVTHALGLEYVDSLLPAPLRPRFHSLLRAPDPAP